MRRGEIGDHGLIDAVCSRFIEDFGEIRTRGFQRTAQADKLNCNRNGLGAAEAHDADTAAAGRSGDGGDGVCGCGAHVPLWYRADRSAATMNDLCSTKTFKYEKLHVILKRTGLS